MTAGTLNTVVEDGKIHLTIMLADPETFLYCFTVAIYYAIPTPPLPIPHSDF